MCSKFFGTDNYSVLGVSKYMFLHMSELIMRNVIDLQSDFALHGLIGVLKDMSVPLDPI
jgi:hypothetical protein